MNDYERKQEERRARLDARAAKAADWSSRALTSARAIASAIPFGQPVLVGHHSERRHRSDIARQDRLMGRAVAEHRKSEALAKRAASVGTGGVSQDDPDAVVKLEAERAKLEKFRGDAKAINAAIRKGAKRGTTGQIDALTALGHSEAEAVALLKPDSLGNVGVPAYVLTNTGASIRRFEKRIAELRAKAATPVRDAIETTLYTISESAEDNRTRIEFAARQPEHVVDELAARGFRWTPSLGVWQRHRSPGAWAAALAIAAMVEAWPPASQAPSEAAPAPPAGASASRSTSASARPNTPPSPLPSALPRPPPGSCASTGWLRR